MAEVTRLSSINGTLGVNKPAKNDTKAKHSNVAVEWAKARMTEEEKISKSMTKPPPIQNNWLGAYSAAVKGLIKLRRNPAVSDTCTEHTLPSR